MCILKTWKSRLETHTALQPMYASTFLLCSSDIESFSFTQGLEREESSTNCKICITAGEREGGGKMHVLQHCHLKVLLAISPPFLVYQDYYMTARLDKKLTELKKAGYELDSTEHLHAQ